MTRDNFSDLIAFIAVAREGSFTRAAARLGLSQSALSHAIRALETRLQLRLLTRTTRSVSPTEAGERLLQRVAPHFEEIDHELEALLELREKPAGTIRITATDYAIRTVLWPKLATFLPRYPDIKVELVSEYGLADIAEQRFDAGVRFGETVAKDMIAVRVGPDVRFAVVGTPAYFESRTLPKAPPDLTAHTCINLRLPTHGGLWAWEFKRGDHALNVRVDGQLVFNSIFDVFGAAVAGLGLAYVPEEMALPLIEEKKLVRVLVSWCPLWAGYHLYYPSRRQPSRAMALLVDALRQGQ
jgi:DNA-binding transcriptional LysR family regulator